MDSPSFSSLPKELVTEVFGRVAVSSHTDLYNAKQCCKQFLEAAEEDYVLQNISLDGFPAVQWQKKERVSQFLDDCIRNKNPEALFRKGVADYFQGNDPKLAVECLDEASRSGHEAASYALAVASIFNGGESREKGIKLLSEMMKSRNQKTIKNSGQRLKNIIEKVWIKNMKVLDQGRLKCCIVHHMRRSRWETAEDGFACDACSCDQEIESITDVFHH